MKLSEASELSARARGVDGPVYRTLLATGFTPLSLQTFVEARLGLALPERQVRVTLGHYGDLLGTIKRGAGTTNAILVCIEWADLDPRLSVRSTARHLLATLDEIVLEARARATALTDAIAGITGSTVVVSAPTLALPPIFPSTVRTVSRWEAQLLVIRAAMEERLAEHGVHVLSETLLAQDSPKHERWSMRSELEFDYPYNTRHADALANELVTVLLPPARRKGLILDLDNTVWSGIVGDDGVQNVSWDLSSRSQHHAFFQRFVNVLAESGILVGIASKNSPDVAAQALAREDLLVEARHLFPVVANWGAKSESVAAIAKVWNVAPDSLVFVDDSALEREEVDRAGLGIATVAFPAGDVSAIPALLQLLRNHFGTTAINDDDKLRVATIRSTAALAEQVEKSGTLSDDVIAGLSGRLSLAEKTLANCERALQLINKTNQFNINGRRWDAAELAEYVGKGGRIIAVDYEDRYGKLGEISALLVREHGAVLHVDAWVLSCRAFARRIEHGTMQLLLAHFTPRELSIDVVTTGRNAPSLQTLRELAGDMWTAPELGAQATVCVTAAEVLGRLPATLAKTTATFLG